MKIGILCGGGDVPGLSTCLKALVLNSLQNDASVFAIRRGWLGLININLQDSSSIDDNIVPLTADLIKKTEQFSPGLINSSRANPLRIKTESIPSFIDSSLVRLIDSGAFADLSQHVLKVIEALGLDVIIVLGGDDTLDVSLNLHRQGLNTIAIPKTMDNDIFGTDYCLGFSTAVSRSVDCINGIRSVAASNERIAIIELFGRSSGETSLISAYLSYADRAFIPEVPYDPMQAAQFLVEDRSNNNNNCSVAVISEGARQINGGLIQSSYEDAFGNKRLGGSGQQLSMFIREKTGVETIYQSLGYLMRSGDPDSLDRMVARGFAKLAIELALNREFGKMTAIRDGKYTQVPLDLTGRGSRNVDIEELYDSICYKPQVLRLIGKPMFLY
jgi:6-phosphofructokinase